MGNQAKYQGVKEMFKIIRLGLITRRSWVQIPPPQPNKFRDLHKLQVPFLLSLYTKLYTKLKRELPWRMKNGKSHQARKLILCAVHGRKEGEAGFPRLHVLDIISDDIRNGGLGGEGIITPSVKRGFQLSELILCKLL